MSSCNGKRRCLFRGANLTTTVVNQRDPDVLSLHGSFGRFVINLITRDTSPALFPRAHGYPDATRVAYLYSPH